MRRYGVWVVAIAVVGLSGCNSRKASVEKTQAALKAAETDEGEERERNALPAVEHAAMRQRLVTTLTKHPETYLTLRGETPSLDMRPRVSKAMSLRLAVPGLQRWGDANIGRLDLRHGDVQESLDPKKIDAKGDLSYTFNQPGPAMVLFCGGPKVPQKGAVWEKVTHCSKIIVNVADPEKRGRVTDINVTHETGLPLEVTPLVPPSQLEVGSEVGVQFAYLNEELENYPVAALRPDGSIDHQVTTGSKGIAFFQISQPGRWLIRFVKNEPEGERSGELVFDIPESKR